MSQWGLNEDRTQITYYDPVARTVKTIPYEYTNARDYRAFLDSMNIGNYQTANGADVLGVLPPVTHTKNVGGVPILVEGPDPNYTPSTQPDVNGMDRGTGGSRNPNSINWQGSSTHDINGNPIPGSSGTWDPWLDEVYQQYLGRSVGQEGLDYWTQQLNSGMSQQDVISAIMDGQEYQTRAAIVEMYNEFFGRNPTEEALDYWTADVLEKGQSIDDVRRSIMASEEYQRTQQGTDPADDYYNSLTPEQKQLYDNGYRQQADGTWAKSASGGGTSQGATGIYAPDYVIPFGTSRAQVDEINGLRAAAGLDPARVQTVSEGLNDAIADRETGSGAGTGGGSGAGSGTGTGGDSFLPDMNGMDRETGGQRNPDSVGWQGNWTWEDYYAAQGGAPTDSDWNWDLGRDDTGFGTYFEDYDSFSQYSPGREAEWGSDNFPGNNEDFYQNQFGNLLRQSQGFQARQRAAALRYQEALDNPPPVPPLDWSWLEGGLPDRTNEDGTPLGGLPDNFGYNSLNVAPLYLDPVTGTLTTQIPGNTQSAYGPGSGPTSGERASTGEFL